MSSFLLKKMMMKVHKVETKMTPADYLKKPYSRLVTPEEDGSYRAEILEFPGCRALADTESEALEALKDVALSWLEGVIESGQKVPEPIEANPFSGKFVLRLPRSLHRKAARAAQTDGVSLNTYITTAVAAYVHGPRQSDSGRATNIAQFLMVGGHNYFAPQVGTAAMAAASWNPHGPLLLASASARDEQKVS